MLYIDPVVVVLGTIAFAGFVVELHGGSWVSPCPGGSLLSFLGRGTGSHRSSVGPSQWRGIGGSGCSLPWLVGPMCRGRSESDDGSAPCE